MDTRARTASRGDCRSKGAQRHHGRVVVLEVGDFDETVKDW
jgi:hypothetical protein